MRVMRVLMLLFCAMLPALAEPVFSHKRHAAVNLECTFCHKGATTTERAGFPAWKTCQTCHTGKPEQSIPSQRVYKLPDFVFFSHGRHATAQVSCATCHGNVKEQASIQLHRSTKMAACVDCHRENRATVVCNACHELGQ